MKKVISLCALILALLLPSIALATNAHSGRTDSSGGHTDRSTGEYHYHHGYSAHDHYDIDGDRDIDCPYDFDDKTSHNSGNSSSKKSSSTTTNKSYTPESNAKSSKISFVDIVLAIFEHLFLGIGIWFSSSYLLSYIFFFIFGEEQGCSISMTVGAIIAIVVSIWLIIIELS